MGLCRNQEQCSNVSSMTFSINDSSTLVSARICEQSNRESERGARSIQPCQNPRAAVAALAVAAAAAVRAQPTRKWDWWMCARFFLKIPRQKVAVEVDKADCYTKCRYLVENSKPLPLTGSPKTLVQGTRSKHARFCIWHFSVSCSKYRCAEDGTLFTHIFAFRRQLG